MARMHEHDCPICFDPITAATGEVRMACTHSFHLGCIGTWLQEGGQTCPYCRTAVQETERLARTATGHDPIVAAVLNNITNYMNIVNSNRAVIVVDTAATAAAAAAAATVLNVNANQTTINTDYLDHNWIHERNLIREALDNQINHDLIQQIWIADDLNQQNWIREDLNDEGSQDNQLLNNSVN